MSVLVTTEELAKLSYPELFTLMGSRARRRFRRGLRREHLRFLNKVRASIQQRDAHSAPKVIRTHLRDMIVLPEMVSAVIGVYNGRVYTPVEIKEQMIGHSLGEFAITYTPVLHGKGAAGAAGLRWFNL